MKTLKLLSGIISLIILLTFASCNSENKIASSFSKRKYTKGYFFDRISAYKSPLANYNKPVSISKNIDIRRTRKSTVVLETKESPVLLSETAINSIKTELAKKAIKIENKGFLPDNCDEIVLANGNIINAHVVEIGLNNITYKECDNLSGPDIVIEKAQVLTIKYANGKVTAINQANNSTTAITQREGDASKNWAAVLGFVLAFFFPLLGLIFSIIGLPSKHHGLALAGVILSAIFLVIVIAALVA